MDISTKQLFKKPNILRIFQSAHTTLVLHSDGGNHCLSAFKPPKEPAAPEALPELYPTCHNLDGHPIGNFIHLNLNGDLLFASLQDDSRLAVASVSSLLVSPVKPVRYIDLQFKGALFSLENIGIRANNIVVAVSLQGELTFIQCHQNLALQTRVYDKLSMQHVLATSVFDAQYLIVFGIQSNHFVFVALRIHAATEISSVRATCYSPVPLPVPDSLRPALFDKSPKISLSACFYAHCIYVMWSNGIVNVLTPTEYSGHKLLSEDKNSIDLWCAPLVDKNSKPNLPVCIQSFSLVSDSPNNPSKMEPSAFVARVSLNFVIVCHGNVVSIWDVLYQMPHGYIQLDQPVRQISVNSGLSLLTGDDSILKLLIPEAESFRPPTLATAIRRKTSCDSVVAGLHAVTDNEPLRAHALTTSPISAAAHAGGQSHHLFSRALDSERERELREIKAVLSRPDTPTAASLQKLGSDYFQSVTGDASSLEVPRLPSDRLAAAFVARCLYEVAFFSQCDFVVPLIDMIGTGVVSMEGVLVALEMSDSWAITKKEQNTLVSSLSDLLPEIGKYTNILEAFAVRVVDLPELDLIHIIHSTAWIRKDLRQKLETCDRNAMETGNLKVDYARIGRLMGVCLRVRLSQRLIVRALSKISFSDALLLLQELTEFMRHDGEKIDDNTRTELKTRAENAEKKANKGEGMTLEVAVDYRGYKRWVDAILENETETRGNGAFEGCVDWIGCILDAHFPSVILDSEGASLASQLLQMVQKERAQRECLQSLKGMTAQLQSQFESSPRNDKMYRVAIQKLPEMHNVI